MVKLINYSLITTLPVSTSADSHICNLLFTHSLYCCVFPVFDWNHLAVRIVDSASAKISGVVG